MKKRKFPRHDPDDPAWPPRNPDDLVDDLREWDDLSEAEQEEIDRQCLSIICNPPIREVLVAEETEWDTKVEIGTWFEGTPWDDPMRFPDRISHARVLHRDIKRHKPVRVVDSWSPAGLATPELLKEYDDEVVLALLAREGGEKAEARSISESIALRRPDEDIRALMELGPRTPAFLMWRIYYNDDCEPVLVQQLAIRSDRVLSHERDLQWQPKQRAERRNR
ncbi:MAG: UTRA domain-containing protein [Actinomycetota bacterium]